jgi:hypothetical protein
MALINKILAYSAIKIKANPPLLHSILKPDTSSDSPSAKSNGVRLSRVNNNNNEPILLIQAESQTKNGLQGYKMAGKS